MNLILTRSYQKQLSTCWEPFATSTPLKVVPNNVDREKQFQKEFLLHSKSFDIIKKLQKGYSSPDVIVKKPSELKQSVTKRPRKNKSCANFDFSSSDDEDSPSENKKRPIIKLSSQKQANILNTKESEKNNVSDVKAIKPNNDHTAESKNKKNNIENIALDDLDSDEENHIFDKTNYSNKLTSVVKSCLQSKENIDTDFKNNDTSKYLQNSIKSKINKSKKISKNKQKSPKQVKNDSQTLINVSETNFKSKGSQKINKRKCKNTVSAEISPRLTRSKKFDNKVITSFTKQNTIGNIPKISNRIIENKINSSHQLFSDSREQELINILDLTSEDVTEKKETDTCLLQPKERDLNYCSPHPSNYTNCFKRSKISTLKKNHNCNKSQLLKNKSNEQLPSEEKQLKPEINFANSKNNEFVEESKLVKKSEKIPKCSKKSTEKNSEENDIKVEKKTKKKAVSKVRQKKEISAPNDAKKNVNNVELKNKEASEVKVSSDAVEDVNKKCELGNPSQRVEDEKISKAEKPVFKLLNELSYKEDKAGCAAVECWDINTFKCGVFRLKVNSQMTCKTLHKNSHLGGSLIKGKLRMKIGNKEHDLNQGDMAFVPPLTEWQATNIGECESIFYYWCGRFKI